MPHRFSVGGNLAFGIGLRRPHFDDIFDNHAGVDFLEILTENYIDFGGRPRSVLRQARQCFPLVMHGVSLSLGSLDPLDERYLDRLAALVQWLQPRWFSDHLSASSNAHVQYHDLIPLPFTEEAVQHVVDRIRVVKDRIGIPFAVENPSYYVELPGAEMSEATFVREVVERADCALLLDINNVYVNAVNHGYDPYAFVEQMPADRVLQYHMAGHDASGPVIIDTHGAPVIEPVYRLYAFALQQLGRAWTLLEWDNDIPSLDRLLQQNDRVRAVARQALASKQPRPEPRTEARAV